MIRAVVVGVTTLVVVPVLLAGAAAAGLASAAGLGAGVPAAAAPTAVAVADIPGRYLSLYLAAAATCPGLPWSVLAGIGKVESDHGRARDQVSSAGAVGPMQFLPDTFARYDTPTPPGGAAPPTPWDVTDAVYAAARLLCANGARNGADIPAAVFAYNHADTYVRQVLAVAGRYAAALPAVPSAPAQVAVAFAVAQIGTPYRWGGDGGADGGFDCSGLTQAAYAAAGIAIPRTAETQWLDLPHVPIATLAPGDLVFFDPGEFAAGLPGHVGIYLGGGQMVDAPHTGDVVRVDAVAGFGQPIGAARPVPGAAGTG